MFDGRPIRGDVAFMCRSVAYLGIQCQLAGELKEKYGIRTVLVTNSPQDLDTFRRMGHDPAVFASVVYFDDVEMRALDEPPPDEQTLLRDIVRVEASLGIRLVDSIRSDRQYGMGFITGAKPMRTPFMLKARYPQLLTVALRMADFMAAKVEEYKPSVIIGYPGTLSYDLLIAIGERQGIPMRGLSAPRRGNYFYWAADRFGLPARFDEQFGEALQRRTAGENTLLPSPGGVAEPKDRPIQTAGILSSRKAGMTLRALVRGAISHCIASFSYHWFKHPRRRMVYLLSDKLAALVLSWRDNRRALRQRPLIDQIDPATPFVFFPLHFEPEASLLTDAVDSPSQLTIIDWLARGAPSGWRIVIKEHPTQGLRRPHGFWETIRRYPNVLVASKYEAGEALMERCAVLATINGTLGLQAAQQLKPAICFHRHYIGKVLPQIWVVESFVAVKNALEKISAAGSSPSDLWRRANEAWRDTWALHEFPIVESALYHGNPVREKLPAAEMQTLTERLMESLRIPVATNTR